MFRQERMVPLTIKERAMLDVAIRRYMGAAIDEAMKAAEHPEESIRLSVKSKIASKLLNSLLAELTEKPDGNAN